MLSHRWLEENSKYIAWEANAICCKLSGTDDARVEVRFRTRPAPEASSQVDVTLEGENMPNSYPSRTVGMVIMLWATITITCSAQTFSSLLSFSGTNGGHPDAPLIQATDGDFYGVTQNGGNTNQICTNGGCGTVFKITSTGVLTTLHQFCAQNNCPDGANPYGPLVQGADGNFYGTTIYGGTNNNGTVFKITSTGTLTTLHSFSLITDGAYPWAGLLQANDGNFYGTTTAGGIGIMGTLFRITPGGALTPLYNFCSKSGCSDGANPYATLVQGTDGNLYGTTARGGNSSFNGTLFKATKNGSLTTLYTFCSLSNCSDGMQPFGPLVQATDGNFYGTTTSGQGQNSGTVFKITSAGALTTLYTFCALSKCADGVNPYGGVIQAIDGNFYGTTYIGGTGQGTIFQTTPAGTLTTLHTFDIQDGEAPWAGLLEASDGSFYGTTEAGGDHGKGTVFKLALLVNRMLTVTLAGNGTVESTDGYIHCPTDCSHRYTTATTVVMGAIPASGYAFSGWTGCDQVNNIYCWVTMTEAKNVTATFDSVSNITLTSLTFNPTYVKGGKPSAATLMLSASAPPGGLGVSLSSDHPGVAHPPPFVVVPEGKNSVQFAVQTYPVKSKIIVTITATAGSSHVNGTLTVGTTSLPSSAN